MHHGDLTMTTLQSTPPFAGLRVALTGGTSGLGLALLRALRERGAHVAFVARDAERVARVAATHPGSRGIAGDVSDKQQTHGLALQLASAFGGIDLLIHNAAALGPVNTPLADTECEDLGAVLDTNLMGPFRLTKALLGSLSAAAREGRPARVLFIGSECATEAYARWGAYSASKAAARLLAQIWDQELQAAGIRVLEHNPGNMDTPMHARALPDTDPATLKRPSQSAAEILALLAASMRGQGAPDAAPQTQLHPHPHPHPHPQPQPQPQPQPHPQPQPQPHPQPQPQPRQDAAPPLDGVDHLHVYVQDRAAAERWYADVLGLRRVEALVHWAADGGPLTLADADDRVHLALFERPLQPNRATIALGVDAPSFLAWRRHLAQRLGAAPEAVDHQLSWSMYFSDPDRNPYEITCYQHGTVAAALQADGVPR
jgi:NAD(P)-dependent dehydrogenase (short-subunit alcohol dehydrogenase family)/catechol 2,3-dioxygenase-like lactoylglutathione lyase family enzyme